MIYCRVRAVQKLCNYENDQNFSRRYKQTSHCILTCANKERLIETYPTLVAGIKLVRYGNQLQKMLLLRCIPVLLYGLEALPLNKSQIASIDFVISRFFMKLFNTNNIEIVKCCQQEFCFSLPSITLARRTENFLGKIRQCDNLLVKRLLCM